MSALVAVSPFWTFVVILIMTQPTTVRCSNHCAYDRMCASISRKNTMRIIHPEAGQCVTWNAVGPEMFTVPGTAPNISADDEEDNTRRLGIWSLWHVLFVGVINDVRSDSDPSEHQLHCQIRNVHSGKYVRFTDYGESVDVNGFGGPQSILKAHLHIDNDSVIQYIEFQTAHWSFNYWEPEKSINFKDRFLGISDADNNSVSIIQSMPRSVLLDNLTTPRTHFLIEWENGEMVTLLRSDSLSPRAR